ncbi:uncharacterized protein LOC5517427 [Nematostella vectensis]|uniref:uncharacterized protein LOC5517427 n=1 Tax=Nematostella vectensis TaxID=45351 RepID=UPI0020771B8E|nr:uncharacterized protein LOC5517427 [Nematostella vectensis]
MFLKLRRLKFVARNLVICGIIICILLSFLSYTSFMYDDSSSVVVYDGSERTFSNIELVKRELLNDKFRRYKDQDFVSKTSDVAHNVFEIAPHVKSTDNELEFYQVDSTFQTPSTKFILVLHHYEQLGKATENLLQLCAMAKEMERMVVQPFVRDSRMCGLPGGWYGEKRSKSRLFRPFSTYFDAGYTNELLSNSGYSTLTDIGNFRKSCSSNVAQTVLVHFIFNDNGAEESLKKWYGISDERYQKVINDVKHSGISDCEFIDEGLNVSNRIGNVKIGRQICIDAEKIKNIKVLEDKILQRRPCVVVIHWRGLGKNRAHFKPRVSVKPWQLVRSMRHSDFILNEVERFKDTFLGQQYISIHIRSERQLQWYGMGKLQKCLKVMTGLVEKMSSKHNTSVVFLSTDLGAFGSDTLYPLTSQDEGLQKNLIATQKLLTEKLRPVTFSPTSKDPLSLDKGVVAIIEMNLLFGGSHLVTVGSGTFQQWIIDVFISRHSQDGDWTVTRVCSKEEKGTNKV